MRSVELGNFYQYNYHIRVLCPKGMSFTANSGTKAAVLAKGRSSTANSRTKVAVLLGMNMCGSFTLRSAAHSEQILKDVKDPRGTSVEVRRVDLALWALRISPKFTTRIPSGFLTRSEIRKSHHSSPPPTKPIVISNYM